MTNYTRNVWIGASVIIALFMGLFVYVGRVGPQMNAEAHAALDEFYTRAQAKNYSGAHALVSTQLADDLSQTKLAARWQTFEKKHGAIQSWGPTTGGQTNIGRVCVFPPFVDFYLSVRGTKSQSVFFTRLKPENGGWRVDRWSEMWVTPARPKQK